ncbi:MAG: pantetheine-phosphate adenylyltransferase [Candidatus Margulisbacteria bacterium]|nr:pantetheine-phosphate adenylyltransferase [Candidatus Margulisiibacteriota bacterium]
MTKAIYPGSFDPITSGHLDILERADKLFDEVTIAVIENPDKDTLFSVQERLDLIKDSTKHLKHVKVGSFQGLIVDYAQKKGATVLIRGLRAVSDFDYEFQMALTNRRMAPDLETVFLMTGYKHSYLSSSLVRQIAKLGGNIEKMVPLVVEKALKEKFS